MCWQSLLDVHSSPEGGHPDCALKKADSPGCYRSLVAPYQGVRLAPLLLPWHFVQLVQVSCTLSQLLWMWIYVWCSTVTSFLNVELTILARLAGLGVCLFLSPLSHLGITDTCSHALLLLRCWVSKLRFHVLELTVPLSHLPNSKIGIFHSFKRFR